MACVKCAAPTNRVEYRVIFFLIGNTMVLLHRKSDIDLALSRKAITERKS